jgi:hypothetical protein
VPQLEQNLPAPEFPQAGQGRAETLMLPRKSCDMERLENSPELSRCSKDNRDYDGRVFLPDREDFLKDARPIGNTPIPLRNTTENPRIEENLHHLHHQQAAGRGF